MPVRQSIETERHMKLIDSDCDCGNCMLRIMFAPAGDNEVIYAYASIWEGISNPGKSLWERVKAAVKMIRYGQAFSQEVVFDRATLYDLSVALHRHFHPGSIVLDSTESARLEADLLSEEG